MPGRWSVSGSELSAAGTGWAIATPHVAATEAGAAAFARGGNAIDAALAAAVTLAVVYPHMCGVGGDLFALVEEPDGEVVCVASSGRSPRRLDVEAVRRSFDRVPLTGPIPITVPGAVAGWDAVHARGARRPWPEAFARAIELAHEGVPVAPDLAAALAAEDPEDPGLRSVFYPDGRPLATGTPLRQPALAATLERLAEEGPGALYRGEVGRRLTEGLARAGCALRADDLEDHQVSLLPPLRGALRGLHVDAPPPNTQGVALLQILELVERLGLDPDPLGPDAPRLARIAAVVSADRDRHLADPDAMLVHASTLLDDGHLAGLADEVRRAEPPRASGVTGGGDTVALVAADADGHAVSVVQSLFDSLGARILEPATGILAHDRGACFVLEPGHPNALAPGKRPAHTLCPALVHDDRGLLAVLGTMGGHAQPQILAQLVLRALALAEAPADAVGAPRWLVGGLEPVGAEPRIVAEADVPRATRQRLEAGGFRVDTVPRRDGAVGHAHVVVRRAGRFLAASDPRADGSAAAG
ncbi:MAG: gamma-glutamyltranspeptidase [Actinomycetota bacterium]|jgi:gamma-glutamyltranspeptidase/glutathione hydrolase|nr:MAG: gamma-glutamyltranspeptidase [Actinomycetota bacterium]